MTTQQSKVLVLALALVQVPAPSSLEVNLAKQEVVVGHLGVSNGWVRDGAVG